MKNLLCAVAVSMALAVPGYAAEPEADIRSCGYWLGMTERDKGTYLVGWIDAIELAEVLTRDETLGPRAWPFGHRVGSVQLEVTIACKINRKWLIGNVISVIAHEKNGVPIPEAQSTPYTRF
jgi:hypothetical protein